MSEDGRGRGMRQPARGGPRRPAGGRRATQTRESTRARRRPGLLKVIPLGGVGEVGKNCTLLEYGDDLVLVDAGVAFPGEDEPGVDLLVPDVSYVRANAQRLRGIVLTHGHEDHIGGLAFVAQQIGARGRIPVYGSPLALGLARARVEERKATRLIDPRPVSAGQRLGLGGLTLEFVPVGHSIPDAMALAIHSSVGPVIYTGDWKFADMPPAGRQRLEELGREGVTALLADCVRIESPGHPPPESVVGRSIERLLREARARVIVTTFASNIRRIVDTITSAHRLGRACVLLGRSLERNIHVAGHAARDDHAELLGMLRPRFVAPFHGEYRMMVLFRRLATELGVPPQRVLLPELGAVLEFGRDAARRHGSVPSGQVLVDGLTVGAVTSVVLRDRRALAAEGLLVISVALERDSGRPVTVPEIVARGLPGGEDGKLVDETRARVERVLERRRRGLVEPRLVHDLIKEAAASFVLHETGLRPMVLPVVTE